MAKLSLVSVVVVMLLVRCDGLRFAPGEVQKQNAWLHSRTAQMAADIAPAYLSIKKMIFSAGFTQMSQKSVLAPKARKKRSAKDRPLIARKTSATAVRTSLKRTL